MIKVAAKLTVIAALAAAGTHFGYQHVEKKLLSSSCLPELPKNAQAAKQAAAALPPPDESVAAEQDFQVIVHRNLFKTAAEKAAAVKPEPPPEPPVAPTALKLTLAGTVCGTEQTARAIIINNAGGDRKQQLLQIGDGVPGTSAVIKAITWNSIELDVNGTTEILDMPKPKTLSGSGSSRPVAMNPPPLLPEPENNPPPQEENNRQVARPNRRISMPDQPMETLPMPEQPTEMPQLSDQPVELIPEELPKIEPSMPELQEEPQPQPELPPVDVQ